MYVEPVYLEASNQAIPEMKRVIVAYGDRISYSSNLEEALEDLFKDDTSEIDYKELAEYLGKSPDTVKKDFCGAKRKGGSFDPRHSKAMQEAGYVWKRGRICKKDTMEDTTKSIVSLSP